MTDPKAIGVAEELLSRLTISPDDLLRSGAVTCGRNALYQALKAGEIESFRIGKRYIIPTAPLRRKLGMAV
jgi:hypothetical protein